MWEAFSRREMKRNQEDKDSLERNQRENKQSMSPALPEGSRLSPFPCDFILGCGGCFCVIDYF